MIDKKLQRGDRVQVIGRPDIGVGTVHNDVTTDLRPERQRVQVLWTLDWGISTEVAPFASLEIVQ